MNSARRKKKSWIHRSNPFVRTELNNSCLIKDWQDKSKDTKTPRIRFIGKDQKGFHKRGIRDSLKTVTSLIKESRLPLSIFPKW